MAHEPLTSFGLKACVTYTAVLHQRNRETLTTPCPKVPSRWLSHDQLTPRPLTCTVEDEVAGGLSGLIGAQPAPMRTPSCISYRAHVAHSALPAQVQLSTTGYAVTENSRRLRA